MTSGDRLIHIYNLLFKRFGPQHWWPGDTPFEIMVGAVLTQNTNWHNVEKALDNLKAIDILHPLGLHQTPEEQLAQLIRPAGYFKVKAKRLRHLLDWLFDAGGGQLEHHDQRSTPALREDLLAVHGIGPETADSILLYAFNRPVFVVDTYTARLAVRHGLIEPPFDYHELQDLFQSNLPPDVSLFNEYHALIVRLGKDFCKPKARCTTCPLDPLPHTADAG